MFKKRPFFRQGDAMDCGPACLKMIAASYGAHFSLPDLRERCYLSRNGVSALGIMEAAESIGFRAMTVKVPYLNPAGNAGLSRAPLPCIAHWNQNHFIVVYKVGPQSVTIADPAVGIIRVPRAEFEKSWVSDSGKGVLVLLEPRPELFRPSETPQSQTGWLSVLREYVRPFRSLAIQVIIGFVVASIFQIAFPFLTQSIIDHGIINRNIGFVYIILAAQIMLFFSQMTVQFIQSRILLFMGARINLSMVHDFLAKIMRLPIGFFDTKKSGDLMQRINDQSRIESFLTHSTLPVLFSLLNFVVFSFILASYKLSIFLIFAAASALYFSWIMLFLRKRKEIDYLRFRQNSENNNTVIELIQGMQEIKLQGSERKRRTLWAQVQARLFHTSFQSLTLAQWQEAGAGFINQLKNIFITFIAAQSVIDGQMTLGMMLATQYMIGQLDAPLQQFITFIRAAQDARISLERLNEVQNQPDENDGIDQINVGSAIAHPIWENGEYLHFNKQNEATAGEPQGGLCIENLSFQYNPLSDFVLKDLDLFIPAGKVTAIVGSSGSGKTTLVKLLLGFYQPSRGRILYNGLSLSSIRPDAWRRRCGTVMQDGFIFSDTIANNITESDENPDAGRLLNACKIANIHTFIDQLPMRYNTAIGAQGNGISQGQRQRLLIARAVYKNPDILFFDEATNALDANNEQVIVKNLQNFYRPGPDARSLPKTVVIVAHRLSTVQHADQIIVLEKGRIIEVGTHKELTANRNAYYNLVRNQLELGN